MSSVQHLREFIRERLNAAADEIFSEFEKTIVQYEEVIDRQRKLLDTTWKPQSDVHTAAVPRQHVWEVGETVEDDQQQLCDQELNSDLDQEQPESAPIKEEEEEVFISQEEEILLKDETDYVSIAAHENDHNYPKSNWHHIPSYTSPVDDDSHLEGSLVEDSGAAKYADRKNEKSCQTKTSKNETCFLLESHYNTHHTADRQYSCETCGETFQDETKLTDHMRFHTGEKAFSCQTCGKSFSSSFDCLCHMRTHTGEMTYSCKTCGKCFNKNSSLLHHMITHPDEKPFACEICGKCFRIKSNMLCHMRTHTGEKPYSCQTCGKCFSHKSDFWRHTRIHTGEKPYSCQTCGKCFNQSSALLRHMRTHR